ncbi:hypothetical protein BS50DRAFT_628208 [Corynespora cassiicola Philippines]|uniref:Uncharacterized protein n=1 Tax=Corynespora cassiicola Philippines TaxID=1448308 RepID=A0A2T2PC60_CORCC|nr:hypothetical protein BS50DRAFT_628208 [Corynespora cassiicola Philippines]
MDLSSLPLELLQQIADCVETVHRPSLYAFSLTSKACHNASMFLIFQHIDITVDHREKLRHDVEGLFEALSRLDSARHVQRISIKGALRLNAKKTDSDGKDTCKTEYDLENILDDEEPMPLSRHYVVYDEPVIKKSSEEDMAWAPVVSLLQAIPHLKDLIYECQSQFPPSLLRALHEKHPHCRLHHLTFRFRTLLWGVPYPYEMELATSPSLYKVKVACAFRDSDGDDDFNSEAIMELSSGLAPNLKEVIGLGIFAFRSSRYFSRVESWHGLPGFTGEALGSLTSLSLKGSSSPANLQEWARHINFSCLQHLTLGSELSGETMDWVVQNHSFPRLRTLSVRLTRGDMAGESPHYSQNAVSFFQLFEPLEQLFVHGPMDSHILDTILSHHGQKLKKLALHPTESPFAYDNGRNRRDIPMEFTKDHILQVQAQCPLLEELAITVKRDMSSASEAERYRCFRKMRKLQSLFLILDCSNWRVLRDSTYNPQFDGEDQLEGPRRGLKRGTFKETLINCAVDEMLARSIWKFTSYKETGRRLERLKLWTRGGDKFGDSTSSSSIYTFTKCLSRSWLIERVPREDRDDITVRELGKHERESREGLKTLREIIQMNELSDDPKDMIQIEEKLYDAPSTWGTDKRYKVTATVGKEGVVISGYIKQCFNQAQ